MTGDYFSCMEASILYNGYCKKLFSVPVGGSCEFDDHLCVPQSFCNSNSFQCTLLGTRNPCDDSENDLISCLIKHQCMVKDDYYESQNLIDLFNYNNTCGSKNCYEYLSEFIDCLCARTRDEKVNQCRFYPMSCKITPYLVPQWILATIVLCVLILVAVVCYVGYLYYKRYHYEVED